MLVLVLTRVVAGSVFIRRANSIYVADEVRAFSKIKISEEEERR